MLVAFLFAQAIYASCIYQFGTAVFDFSNLIGQDLEYKIADLPNTSPFYRVSVCSDLQDPCINGFGAAVIPQFGSLYYYRAEELCTLVGEWKPNDMKIGPLDRAAASLADFGYGISFFFENGPSCNGTPNRIRYNMICDMGSDTGHVNIRQDEPCSFVINWPTKFACVAVNTAGMPGQPGSPGTPSGMPPAPIVPQGHPPMSTVSPANFGFHGNYLGNATCAEPIFDCFAGVLEMQSQLDCKSCSECAIVIATEQKVYSAIIEADVCHETVLAGPLNSKQGLTGYVYLHSYSSGEMVKGTLDIMPYESSKWDIVLDRTNFLAKLRSIHN